MTPKIISYDVEIKSTSKLWVQKVPEVYTNDSNSVEIQFNLLDCTEAELLNSTAQVLLYMRDGSFFQNTGVDVVRTGTTFAYTLKDNEGNHQGLTEVQLVLTIVGTPNEDYASQMYQFKIKNGLGNNVPVETFIQTWETLTAEANAFIAQMEADVQEFDVALESGVLATNIATKLNNLETTYAPRLLSAEQQLEQVDYFSGITVKDKIAPTKGIVTFVTDDAALPDYTLYKPLFASLGVPFCTAVITNNVGNAGKATLAQLLEIQADGHEILSHTASHPHLSELVTEAEVEVEMLNSKNWLTANGFDVETICYPYGYWGEREKAVAKRIYRSARCSDYGLNGRNESPIETFELKAVWLDSTVVIPNDPSGFLPNTIGYYQYYIDKAFETNSWLIIGTHSADINTNGLTQLLTDVVTYAKTKCDILTMSQALDKVGNIFEAGSFGKTKPYVEHFAIGYDGTMSSYGLDAVFRETDAFDGTSTVDAFLDYKVTFNKVSQAKAASSGLPESSTGGILETYKLSSRVTDNVYNYQIYHVLQSGTIYKRLCDTAKVWGAWYKISGSMQVTGDIAVNFNQGISNFKEGITLNSLGGANAALSPTGTPGTLTTYKISPSSTSQYNYQEFTDYAGYKKYKRFALTASTWDVWREISSRTTFPATNGVDGLTAISTIQMGVTYNIVNISVATSSGLPENLNGTLITYKIHATDHTYNYQTYHIAGTAKLYKRSFAADGTPIAWAKISAV